MGIDVPLTVVYYQFRKTQYTETVDKADLSAFTMLRRHSSLDVLLRLCSYSIILIVLNTF